MLHKLKNLARQIFAITAKLNQIESKLAVDHTEIKLLTAKNLINTFDYQSVKPIQHFEFKVFSQWGDDGIIQYLINHIPIEDKSFVEFGVQDYTECNTRFLLINNNWRGLIMDGSEAYMKSVQQEDIYWRYNLKAMSEFITAENINELLIKYGFTGEIGLFHIDIDGNDYWVWKALKVADPIIVIVEYNSLFGDENAWTVPYQPDFVRTNAHFSNTYYGVSLKALCVLAEEKGYAFVGCNSNGNNAYFVRKDKMQNLQALTAKQGYVLSQFSEGRNEKGELTFLKGAERLEVIKGLQVVNVINGQAEFIQ